MKQYAFLSALLFLLCLSPSCLWTAGVSLDYSTYLGGAGHDSCTSIAAGQEGGLYVFGWTYSSNFPAVNPYQSTINPGYLSDAFITRFSSSGSFLIFSTYLGGGGDDFGLGGAVSGSGEAVITGYTTSPDFPTKNPYQASWQAGTINEQDSFVSLLSSSGSALVFSTYLGGMNQDQGRDAALDSANRVYVTGTTYSSDFPTKNAYQAFYRGGYGDIFISRFSPSGSSLGYSTYLGGNSADSGYGIDVDSSGSAYVVGVSVSSNFPVVSAYQSSCRGSYDAVVAKLTQTGAGLTFSTFLGGTGWEGGYGISVDRDRRACVTGATLSNDFPIVNPYQASRNGGRDVFTARLSSSGISLLSSTYLGGTADDEANAIAVDEDLRMHLAGFTESTDFPIVNPYQSTSGGNNDAFMALLSSDGSSIYRSTYLGGTGDDTATGICVDSLGRTGLAGETKSANFPTRNAYQSSAGAAITGFVSSLRELLPPNDFDGDGTSDIALFRGSSGLWAIRGISRVYFGHAGDELIPRDYNGDATTDIAIFRPAAGLWAVKGVSRIYFGSSSDTPVPGDYNGDGQPELAIFRPASGLWAIRGLTRTYFGASGDTPVPADYLVAGVKSIGIFRESTGLWAISQWSRVYFGGSGDIPIPVREGGVSPIQKTARPSIFRPSSGLWAQWSGPRLYFGRSGDFPLLGDYTGSTGTKIGIFRPASSGLWAIREVTRVYYGSTGDIPVTN